MRVGMVEHPILMSSPMVRAILDGRKTQTRRVIKDWPRHEDGDLYSRSEVRGPEMYTPVVVDKDGFQQPGEDVFGIYDIYGEWGLKCPYGKVGDRLWVKETAWYPPVVTERTLREGADTWPKVVYSADVQNPCDDFKEWGWKQKPSIFMPRWASRITLEITAIRVERVQDIAYQDILDEGWDASTSEPFTNRTAGEDAHDWYRSLWDSINGKKQGCSWADNPWAWVVEFKQLAEGADR